MCGIAAILFATPQASHQETIHAMINLVHHRGPDALGTQILMEGCVALGHARLSIIDLCERANQPMTYADTGIWIVYNGEVYNYLELKYELEAMGYHFSTRSDTEVILAAYHAWGNACLQHFNGMFAFVIVDTKRNKLFAARDRLGVKPLYYYFKPGKELAFASEIKQFTALKSWEAKINPQRLFDFLARGLLDHTEETLFRDVYQLRGGQYLELDINPAMTHMDRPRIYTWWTLPEGSQEGAPSIKIASEAFLSLLEDAVRLRLRADVPIGSCLSGGLDSSSIVCLVNIILGREKSAEIQKTFSSCFDDPRFDERGYITEVIAQTKVESQYTFPDPADLFRMLDTITWHQDEPFGSTSIFAQWRVFALARTFGVKVMLDGQGADELLAGYHGFFWALLAGLMQEKNLKALTHEIRGIQKIHGYGILTILMNLGYACMPAALRPMLRSLNGRPDIPSWMSHHTIRSLGIQPTTPIPEPAKSVRSYSYEQTVLNNLPALLHYEDRNSMAHSLEARVPFLDYRLVEYAYALPDSYKIAQGETKKILRTAMQGIIPEKVRNRQDKMGFVTPGETWFTGPYAAEFRLRLNEACALLAGLVDARQIDNLFVPMMMHKKPFDWTLWRILNTGTWMRSFHIQGVA